MIDSMLIWLKQLWYEENRKHFIHIHIIHPLTLKLAFII